MNVNELYCYKCNGKVSLVHHDYEFNSYIKCDRCGNLRGGFSHDKTLLSIYQRELEHK